MTEQYLDPLEQFTKERQDAARKRIVIDGEELFIKAIIGPEAFLAVTTASDEELIASLDRRVLFCLTSDSHEAWARLRDPNRDLPLSVPNIIFLLNHFIAESSGRPYRPARRLIDWAGTHEWLLEGRLTLQGKGREGLTLRGWLTAAYALWLDILTEGTVTSEVLEKYHEELVAPLPEEQTPEQMEYRRQQRIAEQNAPALARLQALAGLAQAEV